MDTAFIRALFGALFGLMVAPACALADPVAPPPAPAPRDVTASVTLTAATDYVWRGASQTNQGPVMFVEVDLSAHGFYLDGRTENVNFPGVKQEYDNRAGYVLPIGPVKLDLGFIRYGFVNAPTNIDQLEGTGTLSADIGKLNLHGSAFYTKNYSGTHRAGGYYEVGGTWTIRNGVTLVAAAGHQQVDQTLRYNTWNLGLTFAVRKALNVNLLYVDTDTRAFGALGAARLVGSIDFTF